MSALYDIVILQLCHTQHGVGCPNLCHARTRLNRHIGLKQYSPMQNYEFLLNQHLLSRTICIKFLKLITINDTKSLFPTFYLIRKPRIHFSNLSFLFCQSSYISRRCSFLSEYSHSMWSACCEVRSSSREKSRRRTYFSSGGLSLAL